MGPPTFDRYAQGRLKLQRYADADFLFNLQEDPLELTNLIYQNPEKYQELTNDLMQWRDVTCERKSWPGKSSWSNLCQRSCEKLKAVDPRYKIAGEDSAAIAYPAPIQTSW